MTRLRICQSCAVRWHYRDGGLLWPFVPAFAIHVAEEWFGGFTRWAVQITGEAIPGAAFLGINAIAIAVMVVAIRAAARSEANGWLAVTIATIALINTVSHAAGAVFTQSYAPGLISAVVLYVPLGSVTMVRAMDQAPRGTVARGVIAGALLHGLVFVVAFASTR
jgi:hypothetical protein